MDRIRPNMPASLQLKRQYFELMHSGYNRREAGRQVGVSTATAQYWFEQAGAVTIDKPQQINPRFLSLEDRIAIADGIRAARPYLAIAQQIGKSDKTIYREVDRNSRPNGAYDPYYAHNHAYLARRRDRPAKLEADAALRAEVADKLHQEWSPRQIAEHLKDQHPDDKTNTVCEETIYKGYYAGLLGKKKPRLRTGRTKRKPRKPGGEKDTRGRIRNMISIRDRPLAADRRAEPGHWEGDLIIGKNQNSQIGTIVDRKTRYLRLIHLPHGHTAEQTRDALVHQLADLPTPLRRTLTWDQGKELAYHEEITELTGITIYFCDPHSPWQRPTNENTNGLLRQYFPKGTDLSVHTLEDLRHVEHRLNTRPRHVLGWTTPEDGMAQWLPRQQVTLIRKH
jgi:IS30 family transposase